MNRKDKDYIKFLNTLKEKIQIIGNQISFELSMTNEYVQNKMKDASIVVVPSIWQDSFGLVVVEAMSNGAAVLASNVGGIPEVLKNNGMLIKNINADKISISLKTLMSSSKMLSGLQKKSWNNFDHSGEKISQKLDDLRKIFIIYFNTTKEELLCFL